MSCEVNARDSDVAELFDKYNLRSLPVVDKQGKVVGAIHTAEQVIAQLLEGLMVTPLKILYGAGLSLADSSQYRAWALERLGHAGCPIKFL